MRGAGRALRVAIGVLAAVVLHGGAIYAGTAGTVLPAGFDGGGGGNKDIAVRQVTVTPVRAHVGDAVRVDVVIENRDDGYETVPLKIYANGKEVAWKLFTFGWTPAERIYRETLTWSTQGVSPGEYRIRAEAFVWGDSSPSDNFLEVKEAVILSAPGTPFPDGAPSGGSATETDPRFGK